MYLPTYIIVCNTYLYLLQFKLLVNIETCRETVARFNVDISCSFVYHSVMPLAFPAPSSIVLLSAPPDDSAAVTPAGLPWFGLPLEVYDYLHVLLLLAVQTLVFFSLYVQI